MLTSFPRLLEEHGTIREMDCGEDGYSGGMLGELWGGKRERRGSDAGESEGERTLVGSGQGAWRSVFSI